MSFLREKLGSKKFNALMESLQSGNKHVVNFNINHKSVDEYSTEELQGLLEKVKLQVEELEKKLSVDGINEADSANLNKRLEKQRRLIEMLSDEIDFRNAIKESDDDSSIDPFSGVDAVPSGNEEEKNDENAEESSEKKDDDEKNADEKTDDEQNPDEDETIELSQIVITLASKESAEDLKNDLIEAGIPEDVLEVKSASEDEESEEEDDNKEEKSDEEEKTDEKPEENAEEEPKADESVKPESNAVNEADDDENADKDDSDSADENQDNTDEDASSEEGKDGNGDEPYKVILKNTDYANELAGVLQDIWGMEKDEFNNLIGGEIVDDDDSGEAKDDENSDGSSDDNGDADGGDNAAEDKEDELSAEDIFKGL